MSLEAAEGADVIRQALMILSSVRRMNKYRLGLLTEGSAFIPARSMAITNGEAAAVPVPARSKPGELDGTSKPITAVPRT